VPVLLDAPDRIGERGGEEKSSMKSVLGVILAISLAACTGTSDSAGAGSDLGSAGGKADGSGTASRLVVHYPAGYGHRISVRGEGGGLSWDQGRDGTWNPGDAWVLDFTLTGPISLKPLYDDETWAQGPNDTLYPGQTLDVWPFFFHEGGRIEVRPGWRSPRLAQARDIEIYLPPSYDENPNERYPVIYMQDGQNLWSDDDSATGVSWDVAGAMDDGALQATIHEAIVVGIDNTSDRTSEYTPVPDPDEGGGGADAYIAFIADELKPVIDHDYRTFGDRDHTAIVGSSLGALASLYAGISRPDVFGLVGALSPATWWDNEWITGAEQSAGSLPARLYLDSGDSGDLNDDVTLTAHLADVLRGRGVDLDYLVQQGAEHSEVYWRQRLPGALGFLVGGR
jgi:predicted alpha/beta superfamily hydrolase